MLCTVIKGPDFTQAHLQILQAHRVADLIELRLDTFENCEDSDLDWTALKDLQAVCKLPLIFTLRPLSQGGNYKGSEERRLLQLERLAELNPDYMDLEYDLSDAFVSRFKKQHPQIKLILSYHNFAMTPEDLNGLLESMREIPADYYKIACMAHSSLDGLKMLKFLKTHANKNATKPLIGISMGNFGRLTRVLGVIFGSPWTYTVLNQAERTAPGQLTIAELLDLYNYRSLNAKTLLCGLIGECVEKSVSHFTHNAAMRAHHLNAVYVKIALKPEELPEFFSIAKELNFSGLSVTMPYKEAVLAHLDHLSEKADAIGAVNTLFFEESNRKICGYNSDGKGAFAAIQEVFEGDFFEKRVVIIGAGGAAKAIACEAHLRGCHVTILNRNKTKAMEYAAHLGCLAGGLEEMADLKLKGYDILINCTPVEMPIASLDILATACVMDIKSHPRETEFLISAQKKGCRVIYGYRMFVHQAVEQFQIWFGPAIESQKILKAIEESLPCSSLDSEFSVI